MDFDVTGPNVKGYKMELQMQSFMLFQPNTALTYHSPSRVTERKCLSYPPSLASWLARHS